MLTDKTQAAITLLREIAYSISRSCPEKCTPISVSVLRQLAKCGIISLLPGGNPSFPRSYKLCRSLSDISLYELLSAIGEGVVPVAPGEDEEHIYKRFRYGPGASRLGVINRTLHTMLDDVSVAVL